MRIPRYPNLRSFCTSRRTTISITSWSIILNLGTPPTASIVSVELRDEYKQKLLKDIEKDSSTLYDSIRSPRTKARLINQRNDKYTENVQRIDRALNAKLQKYQEKKIISYAETAATNGDIEMADKWIDIGIEHGLFDDVDGDELKDNNAKDYIVGLYRAGLHDEARKVLEASTLDNKDKEALDDAIDADEATLERKADEKLREDRDTANRQALQALWDGDLEMPDVSNLMKTKMISPAEGKYLRAALLSPKARVTQLANLDEVMGAVVKVGTGAISRDDARLVLYKNLPFLSNEDGKAQLKAIYTAVIKDEAFWLNESRSYMEKQIRETDPISGMFSDNAAEIAFAAQANLALDKIISDAEKAGKPLTGRDVLIKAHDIMLPLRQQAAEMRDRKKVPQVIGKGLGEVPFITEADLDRAESQARKNLGKGATKQQIKAEMLRLLGG